MISKRAAGIAAAAVLIAATTTGFTTSVGTGTAAWNGPNPVRLDTVQTGSSFALRDPSLPNLKCQRTNNAVFTGTDNAWGDGDPTHLETACVDALFAAQTEARMLRTWLGRNGFTNSGDGWPITIDQTFNAVAFDSGQIRIGRNLMGEFYTQLDLVGRAFGTGIDQETGGLSGGGTREFIADVFGTVTEWFANEPNPFDIPDFTVGERAHFDNQPPPLRSMYQPSLQGIPDCYTGNTDPFTAVGVGDHWFYLVAEGSAPTNGQPASPTCDHTTVTGVGVQTAMLVLYNAMLAKPPRGSSYPTYRRGTLVAAKNLFPGNCQVFNTVKAAWDAVSVPPLPGETTCV